MKNIVAICILLFNGLTVFGQLTEQQKLDALQAQMKSFQQKGDSLMKLLQQHQQQKPAVQAQPPVAAAQSGQPRLSSYEKLKLPQKDSIKIQLLPKAVLSVQELDKYLIDLYRQMRSKFPTGSVKLADDIANAVGHQPQQLEAASTVAWLKGYTPEAALLIMEGATLTGRDGLLLTNAGAMLDLAGLGYKAIPILRTLVTVNPENAIAQNNLGQAYCGIGLIDSATRCLKQCIAISPEHPEANNTLGFIEFKRGNKGAAKSYFENSIRGGFTNGAYQGLRAIDRNNKNSWKIKHFIMPRVKFPEYFNQYKFQLPKQCENTSEAEAVESAQTEFIRTIGRARSKYSRLASEQGKIVADSVMAVNNANMKKAREGKAYMRPFQVMATILQQEFMEEHYSQEPTALSRFNEDNRRQLKQLQADYDKAYDLVSSDCKAANALKNQYLPQFAALNLDWQIKNMKAQQDFLEAMLFWQPIAAGSHADAKFRFYTYVHEYLKEVEAIARQYIILKPCKEREEIDSLSGGTLSLQDYDCPFTVSKSLVVAELQMDCEKIAIKGHFEVANFSFERNIKTRQSTLSIGIGDNLYNKGFEIDGIKANVSADVGMSLYLTVDASGFNDAGMLVSATASAGVEFEQGERLKFSKDKNVSVGASYRFGIQSGLDIRDGSGRDLLAPTPEKPLNKNVKVYPQ